MLLAVLVTMVHAAPTRTLVHSDPLYDAYYNPLAEVAGGNHYFTPEEGNLTQVAFLRYVWMEAPGGPLDTVVDTGFGQLSFNASPTTDASISGVLVSGDADPLACLIWRSYESKVVKSTGLVSSQDRISTNQNCTGQVKHTQTDIDSSAREVHSCWTWNSGTSDDAFCNQRPTGTTTWSSLSVVQLGGSAGTQEHAVVAARSGGGSHAAILYRDGSGASGAGLYLRMEITGGSSTFELVGGSANWPDIKESGDGNSLVAVWDTGSGGIGLATCTGTNSACDAIGDWTITTNILAGLADDGDAHKPQVVMDEDENVFVTYERYLNANDRDVRLAHRCSGGAFGSLTTVSDSTMDDAELGLGNATAWSVIRGDAVNEEIDIGYVQRELDGSLYDAWWFSQPIVDFCP